jgi:hypothetical protein
VSDQNHRTGEPRRDALRFKNGVPDDEAGHVVALHQVLHLNGAGLRQPLEKVLMIRENPLLERATVSQLLDLATVTREVSLTHGSVLFNETDPPALYYVLTGEIRLDGNGASTVIAGAGSTIGMSETLAGVSLGRRAVVTRDGLALRLDHDELFDVLADHIDLLQGVFSALLQAHHVDDVVLDGAARR